MDGCATHASVAIYTGREKANIDSHTLICDTYIHLGHSEVLLRVSNHSQNIKPLKDGLTLHAQAR